MDIVKRFPKNPIGRDFVVGDIHGAYALLAQAMAGAAFDPERDRLFCVGDLVDRGPDSAKASELLARARVHSIRGNHDHDFSELSLPQLRALAAINFNGLGWASSQPDEILHAIQAAFSELPVAIQIETDRGSVGLVHGEVPLGMAWDEFLDRLRGGDPEAIQSALWGRLRVESGDESGVPGIGRIFCGHTIQWGGPKRLGNVHFIDTGAVFHELGHPQGAMTLANLSCCTAALGAPTAAQAGVNLFASAGTGPFGAYAADPFAAKAPKP